MYKRILYTIACIFVPIVWGVIVNTVFLRFRKQDSVSDLDIEGK